MMCTCQ